MRYRRAIRSILHCGLALAALLPLTRLAVGQEQRTLVPAISGAVAFLSSTNRGPTSFTPAFMPTAIVPLSHYFLFETRGYFVEPITPRLGGKSDQTRLVKQAYFLTLDFFANSHMTVMGGKFLTPFASYNERLTPLWISNYGDAPQTLPIGNLGTQGVGGELRGSLFSNDKVAVDYTTFMSANVTGTQFKSQRATGGRLNFYFPQPGLEIGTSFDHPFQGAHPNAAALHVWWTPHNAPVTMRSEYSHGTHSQGYWIETAYRLSNINGPDSAIGRLMPVFRMQQTFRHSPDSTDGMPGADLKRADFGLDYFFPKGWRINTSYSRQFSTIGNGNIWKTGLIYFFTIPAWRGK